MKHEADPLIKLIQTIEDGIEFYQLAKDESRSTLLTSVFTKMIAVREFALAYIIPYVDSQSTTITKALSCHDTLTNPYAPLLKNIIEDKSLKSVKEVEAHLTDAMQLASQQSHSALVQCILKGLSTQVSQNFEQCRRSAHQSSNAAA